MNKIGLSWGLAAVVLTLHLFVVRDARAQNDMGGTANAAQQAAKKDGGNQMAAALMAAMLASQCNPPTNIVPCILAPIAAAQAGAAGKSKAGSIKTAVNASQGTQKPPDIRAGDPGVGLQLDQARAELEQKGFKYDDSTITMPDGTQLPINANTASDAGLRAAGASDLQLAMGRRALEEAQVKAAEALAKYKDPEMPSGGGSGVGGGGVSASSTTYVARSAKRAGANLSGLSKNMGGDKIGVSADNIFEMITRRYKDQDAKQTFIKN